MVGPSIHEIILRIRKKFTEFIQLNALNEKNAALTISQNKIITEVKAELEQLPDSGQTEENIRKILKNARHQNQLLPYQDVHYRATDLHHLLK